MATIRVVGHNNAFEYDDVKDTVILLGGKYYFKHDEQNLVKIRTENGKFRLYRKESPLIVRTLNGTYVKRSEAIEIADKTYLDKNHKDTIKLQDGTYSISKWTVRLDNKNYLITDPLLVETQDGYRLKSNCCKLAESYYGKNKYEVFNPDTHIEIDGEIVRKADTREILSWNTTTNSRVITIYPKWKITGKDHITVFKEFRDLSNPQIGRYNTCYAAQSDVVRFEDGLYVLRQEVEWFNNKIIEIAESESKKLTENARKKLNSSFSDLDDTENTAKKISKEYQIWPGKHRIYGGNSGTVTSKSIKMTGGLGYAFGVELETSAGVIPQEETKKLQFLAVGDRSIGAAEYVTPVLHGDRGIKHLQKLTELLAANTFVDDRCSVHVHIGPAPGEGLNSWDLKFDKNFAMAAIKLGCMLEEELYQMLPKSRNPYNRHCHSIQRYRGINEDNWKEHLGTFVFGPQENWNSALDMRAFKYGEPGCQKSNSLSTWCGGRYKWLNLVRAYSSCDSPTIELRIWSPSTNFSKVYNYVLLSLAFVYVADHHQKEVMSSSTFTLKRLLELAFTNYGGLQMILEEFIEKRKKAFNRKEVYVGVKPEALKTVFTIQKEKV